MKVLITGGNGFVGSALARRLVGRGDRVRCLLREKADTALLEGVELERVRGDVTEPASLAPAVKDVDVVYHLAGLRRSPHREDFFRVNAEGTRHLLEAMSGESNPARMVLASALAAGGPRRDHPSEEAPLAPQDWYGESKAEAERIAQSFEGRVPVVAARISRILGPGDRENLFFFRTALKGIRLSVGGGPRPISTIDVEDVVSALLLLGERPEAENQAFFVSHETTDLEGIQDAAARALGARPRTIWLPPWGLRGVARVAEVVSGVTGKHLPINRKLAQHLLVPGWTCSTRKAEERLGFKASVTMAESMAAAASWYREKGWLPAK